MHRAWRSLLGVAPAETEPGFLLLLRSLDLWRLDVIRQRDRFDNRRFNNWFCLGRSGPFDDRFRGGRFFEGRSLDS